MIPSFVCGLTCRLTYCLTYCTARSNRQTVTEFNSPHGRTILRAGMAVRWMAKYGLNRCRGWRVRSAMSILSKPLVLA
ncbi:hypothetical protein K227x_31270 [Rubripirellula lacrimiformis]|uniref:Uncharacterized protein n=1 Tax=Rubripirellula lacrimiformis TaxID=1930273 RepID=A0A517NC68_9BACT|nr:hypothetical protein K227x_31270 [Rubripirellula lacrimiformis]